MFQKCEILLFVVTISCIGVTDEAVVEHLSMMQYISFNSNWHLYIYCCVMLHDFRTVSTIQKETGVNNVYLVTMATHVKGLRMTARDACALLAHLATSELITAVIFSHIGRVLTK